MSKLCIERLQDEVFLSIFEEDIVKKCKFHIFLELWITPEIINVAICSLTHFKGKFTNNVKKFLKNYTILSLDSEKLLTYEFMKKY